MSFSNLTYFLLTGMSRSGTSLLNNLVNYCAGAYCGMQVFPQLFIDVKRAYLQSIECPEPRFVFSNYCDQQAYGIADFSRYLSDNRLTSAFVETAIGRPYKGQLECPDFRFGERVVGGELAQVYKGLLGLVVKDRALFAAGTKHILLDEFLPYFCSKGIGCVSIVRNPTDVIFSSKFGDGLNFVGGVLPTLYELRNWRRSVHMSIYLARDPNFKWIQYESLVSDPKQTLKGLFEFLGVKNANKCIDGAISHVLHGKKIHPSNNGSNRPSFAVDYRRYVEAVCWSEMKYLGYPVSLDKGECEEVIRNFREPIAVDMDGIAGDYTRLSDNVAFELEKLNAPSPVHFLGEKSIRDEIVERDTLDNREPDYQETNGYAR